MNKFWERLSQRERLLAVAVLVLVGGGLIMLSTTRTIARIGELDRLIDQLEQHLLNYEAQEARGVSVNAAFAEVAAEHSSAWTKAEIHHRLRREIYRLAAEDPDVPNPEGQYLVEIPRLGQGVLKEGGTGYREYQLAIRIPQTDIYSLVMFIVRLQQSPQSLRIDALDFSRSPTSQFVNAQIVVTRTIVDGAPGADGVQAPVAPQPALVAWDGSDKAGWQGARSELAVVSEVGDLYPEGGSCLKIHAGAATAEAFMNAELEAGTTYELVLQATATGNAELRIVNEATGEPFAGAEALPGDGKTYEYQVRFTVPGEPDGMMGLRVPFIALEGEGSEVYVDNVVIRQAME